MAREHRVFLFGDPDRQDQEGGERRLRDEQLGHPLEVAEHLAALGDHRRHSCEIAANEHDVGDALRHLRAGALRDREPRLLQRGYVVDAVADHRHVVARLGQRLDDPLLPLGRDTPDHGRLEDSPPERIRILRKRASVERRPCRRDAGVRGDGRDGDRGSRRRSPSAGRPGRGSRLDRLARVRSQSLGQNDEAERREPLRGPLARIRRDVDLGECRRRLADGDDAAAGFLLVARPLRRALREGRAPAHRARMRPKCRYGPRSSAAARRTAPRTRPARPVRSNAAPIACSVAFRALALAA